MADEINYGEVFGVEEGGNGQEVAAPAEETAETAQGENGQEVAVPAEEKVSRGDANQTEEKTEAAEEQKTQRNAEFAAARRKAEAERDAAVQQAKQDAAAEAEKLIGEVFKATGMMNPYTGKPITNREEFAEYQKRFASERRDNILKKTGMSDEEFDAYLKSLPVVRQAEEAKGQAEAALKAARAEQAKAKMDEELREIAKLDPNIKGLDDLAKMPEFKKFYDMVERGYSMLDAFRLVNFDAIQSAAAAASAQKARNAAASKQHMTATSSRGEGAVSVPKDVKEMYRMLNPEASDAEIAEHYARNHK